MQDSKQHIVVLGGGAWGTALASMLAESNKPTSLWARDANLIEEIAKTRQNRKYLKDAKISQKLVLTSALSTVTTASLLLVVTPAQSFHNLVEQLEPYGKILQENRTPLVLCAKGIDRNSGQLLSEMAKASFPSQPIAALSGPSFAADVVKNLPTAVTLACEEKPIAKILADTLSTPVFRPYISDDLIGVEVGGALKNIMAIAVGIARGLSLGKSAEAALIARGFAELQRIALALGAKAETLTGLSGLGDLVLTCSSTQSRNFSYGIALAEAQNAKNMALKNLPLAEGVHSAKMAVQIAKTHQIEAPILEAVDGILDGKFSAAEAVTALLSRPLKTETGI